MSELLECMIDNNAHMEEILSISDSLLDLLDELDMKEELHKIELTDEEIYIYNKILDIMEKAEIAREFYYIKANNRDIAG